MLRRPHTYFGAPPPLIKRRARKYIYMLVAVVFAYIAFTYYQIDRQSEVDEARPADAIVVFGAAEYSGKPSPVLRARLDHALDLYKRGLAPYIITTGGNGDDPNYSEGGVGRAYLIGLGVPERNIIAETQSDDTDESSQRVARIASINHIRTCLVVSDGYHIYRIKKMMAKQGVTAYGSPRPGTSDLSLIHRSVLYLREVVSITLWRLHIT
jgi:uncharacterized SAM-binding protein YcdF (DUF218 family)